MAKKSHETHDEEHKSEMAGMMRWLLTYADLITLLLGLFIILAASSGKDQSKYDTIAAQAARVFGGGSRIYFTGNGQILEGAGKGILPYVKPPEAAAQGQEGKPQVSLPPNVKVIETETGTLITLKSQLLFDSGKANIRGEAKDVLAVILKDYIGKSNRRIMIKGHTDDRPISNAVFPSNWELSAGRAGAVARILINMGLSPNRVATAGYADTEPVDTNATDEGRQANRRVEIFLLNTQADSMMKEIKDASKTSAEPIDGFGE